MPTVLFVGGASVGHIAPSIAVQEALVKLVPRLTSHFACLNTGLETSYLEENGLQYTTLRSPGLSPSLLWQFPRVLAETKRMLDAVQPDVVFSKGGHVSVPVCFMAWKRGIPIILHESDAVSGRANRLVWRIATKVCTGFPRRTSDPRYTHTGNPVREYVTRGSREEGLALTGFAGTRPVLLVLGGSQGAMALNAAVEGDRNALLEMCDVIHITGSGKATQRTTDRRYWQREFVTGELPHLYAVADLALTRAGAGTLGELAANGIPAIVVPLRSVGHDHQQKNAEAVAEAGGCLLLQQDRLQAELVQTVRRCLEERGTLAAMSAGMRACARPEASVQIAQIIAQFLA